MRALWGRTDSPQHDPGGGHVERPQRFAGIEARPSNWGVELDSVTHQRAGDEALLRVHSAGYLRALRQLAEQGGGWLDSGDTWCGPDSESSAREAVGVGLALLEALGGPGAPRTAFALVRPPGHHALASRAMGFCLYSTAAILVRAAQARGHQRVAVLDWDIHHGNGTQAVFWDDPEVLTASIHRWPFWPGSGSWEEKGGPGAEGSCLNLPMPAGFGPAALEEVWERWLAPALSAHAPSLVIVSAGFDAHWDDPLSDTALSRMGLARLAASLRRLFPDRPILATLEGGYNPRSLPDLVGDCLYALASGETPDVGGEHCPPEDLAAVRVRLESFR